MRRQVWRGHSAALDRELRVVRWGHYGRPVLWMSAAGGDALEPERYQLIEPLGPLIEGGRVKLYATDSLGHERWLGGDEGWTRRWLRFVGEQVCPLMHQDSGLTAQRFFVVGASAGGLDALLAGLRWPGWFTLTAALSPAGPRPHAERVAAAIRDLSADHRGALAGRRFVLGVGAGHLESPGAAEAHLAALEGAGLSATLRRWGPESGHDHGAWRAQLPRLLGELA